MKVLLINPPFSNYSGIKSMGGKIFPLNLAYLVAYMQENSEHNIKILDAEIRSLRYEQMLLEIKEYNPHVIGITTTTQAMGSIIKVAELVKKNNPSAIIVLGGPHSSALPKETIKLPNIDFLVIGEGEHTFLELVNELAKKKKNFKKINGLVFLENGKIVVTKERELIKNLDELPFPARDLFDLEIYDSTVTQKVSTDKSTAILSGRGCPYNCIHCISKVVWKQKFRMRSPKNFVDEIEECINKYGIKEFLVEDDTFTIYPKRAIEICKEILRRKLKISWICNARVDRIDKKMVFFMKKAGCKKIAFGLESGSQELLDLMRKNVTLNMAREAVKIVKNGGVETYASFMLGNLGETEETIKETIKFAKDLDLDTAIFFITSPYPGTDLYDIAKEKGFINEHTSWEKFDRITNVEVIPVQENLSPKELAKWQKIAFKSFYFRPKRVIREVLKIKSLKNFKLLLKSALLFLRIEKSKLE